MLENTFDLEVVEDVVTKVVLAGSNWQAVSAIQNAADKQRSPLAVEGNDTTVVNHSGTGKNLEFLTSYHMAMNGWTNRCQL